MYTLLEQRESSHKAAKSAMYMPEGIRAEFIQALNSAYQLSDLSLKHLDWYENGYKPEKKENKIQ